MSTETFLPPFLQQLGYGKYKAFSEVARRAMDMESDPIQGISPWYQWRGILEYLTCVEFARTNLLALPTGRELGSVHVVPARYHSASLVFFAQATLDNAAVWLSDTYAIQVKGSDCAFHKTKFQREGQNLSTSFSATIAHHKDFVTELEKFRQEWIHRLSGGAEVFSDRSPSDPSANIQLAVPINPAINGNDDRQTYLKMIHKCQQKNQGKWLYPVAEFANRMADGTRDMMIGILQCALELEPPRT